MNLKEARKVYNVGGTLVINVTKHPVNFEVHGEIVVVPPSGVVLSAEPRESVVEQWDNVGANQWSAPSGAADVTLVKTSFVPTAQGLKDLEILQDLIQGARVLFVGSIIAAQAYGPPVAGMTPVPGFERVPPAEKLMNPHKFTIFPRDDFRFDAENEVERRRAALELFDEIFEGMVQADMYGQGSYGWPPQEKFNNLRRLLGAGEAPTKT